MLSAHREENIDTEKNFISLFTAINALADKYDMPILYSCHPRSKNRLEKSGFKLNPRVRINEPLGFNDYNKLQMNALAIVSDSGTQPDREQFLSLHRSFDCSCVVSEHPRKDLKLWKQEISSLQALRQRNCLMPQIWLSR